MPEEDKRGEEILKSSIKIVDGRFEVALMWADEHPEIQSVSLFHKCFRHKGHLSIWFLGIGVNSEDFSSTGASPVKPGDAN